MAPLGLIVLAPCDSVAATMRMTALLGALALCAGCGSDPSPFVPEDVTRTDAGLPPYDGALADRPTPDRPPVDVLDLTDVAPLEDAPASDVVCSPTLGGTVTFGLDGGLVAFVERFVLSAPATFRAERRSGGAMGTVAAMCETTLPGCNTTDMVDVGELNAALGARDVQIAFGAARGMPGMQMLYGTDPRPMDGTVFAIEADGVRLFVGSPCRAGMMAGCLATPVGVQRLVDVLTALRDQELLRAACMTFRTR